MAKVTNQDNKSRSRPHRRVEKILDELNLNYESERYFAPYTVDIYLPEWHLAIEVDGPFHSKEKDIVRDEWLKERYGIIVHRIDVKKPWITSGNTKENIIKFIEEFSPTFYERKVIWLSRL